MQVNRKRQQSLAIRWILGACREKKGRPMAEKLAAELAAAYNREGVAITKRENVHRMADANKAWGTSPGNSALRLVIRALRR